VYGSEQEIAGKDKRKTTPVGGSLADPKRYHRVVVIFEDDERRGTYVVTRQISEFQNEHHLKALGLQVSVATYDREQLNSLKAFDMDILTGFGIIVDPQIMCTNNLNLKAIANPREMVYYSLEVDAALTAMIIIIVLVDENLRTKKKRPRRRMKEKRENQIEKARIG